MCIKGSERMCVNKAADFMVKLVNPMRLYGQIWMDRVQLPLSAQK